MTTIFFQQIQSHDAVRFVEEDGIAYADDVTWGIDRVDPEEPTARQFLHALWWGY